MVFDPQKQETICQTTRDLYVIVHELEGEAKEQAIAKVERIYLVLKKLNRQLYVLRGQDASRCGNEAEWMKQIRGCQINTKVAGDTLPHEQPDQPT